MRALRIAGVAALVLLPSTAAFAQGIAPGWECQTNGRGERSCRAIWDTRDKAPQPMIKEGSPRQ